MATIVYKCCISINVPMKFVSEDATDNNLAMN